eukprot:7386581-Prymnesium_polylepis.1
MDREGPAERHARGGGQDRGLARDGTHLPPPVRAAPPPAHARACCCPPLPSRSLLAHTLLIRALVCARSLGFSYDLVKKN